MACDRQTDGQQTIIHLVDDY